MVEIAAESRKCFGSEIYRVLMRDGVIYHMVGKNATHHFYIGEDSQGDRLRLQAKLESLDNSTEDGEIVDKFVEGCYLGDKNDYTGRVQS